MIVPEVDLVKTSETIQRELWKILLKLDNKMGKSWNFKLLWSLYGNYRVHDVTFKMFCCKLAYSFIEIKLKPVWSLPLRAFEKLGF